MRVTLSFNVITIRDDKNLPIFDISDDGLFVGTDPEIVGVDII